MLQILKDRAVTTLGVGGTELLTADGIDVSPFSRLSFVLKNTGAADLTDLAVYWLDSFGGSDWSPADTSISLVGGVLAATETLEITVTDLSRAKMRVAVTGTSGETVRLTLSVTWN